MSTVTNYTFLSGNQQSKQTQPCLGSYHHATGSRSYVAHLENLVSQDLSTGNCHGCFTLEGYISLFVRSMHVLDVSCSIALIALYVFDNNMFGYPIFDIISLIVTFQCI